MTTNPAIVAVSDLLIEHRPTFESVGLRRTEVHGYWEAQEREHFTITCSCGWSGGTRWLGEYGKDGFAAYRGYWLSHLEGDADVVLYSPLTPRDD